MDRLKAIFANWCRNVGLTIERVVSGTAEQMLLPLGNAQEGHAIPDRYRLSAVPCDDEPDDEDEPTEDEANAMRMAKRRDQQQYTSGSHAPEAVFPSRPWREPEPLDRIVAEGKAAARRLGRTLQVPAETREAGYRAQQAWNGLERGKYAAKKGKGKSKRNEVAA